MNDQTKDYYGNVIKLGSTVTIVSSSEEFVVTELKGCDNIAIDGTGSDLYFSSIQGNRVIVQ